jgi:hypothetical protein
VTATFYRDLPVLDSFAEAVDSGAHRELPDDWWIVVTDIVGSTKAIERGAYKLVNSVGVATIVAIVNVDLRVDVPYVFGGDGCIAAVPPSMEAGARRAILGCKDLARDGFGLELRAGMVPARTVREAGQWLRVGKVRLSPAVVQAALSGRGWEAAERLVKDAATRERYEVVAAPGIEPDADLSGYECRWQGVAPQKDCSLCVIVQCLDPDGAGRAAAYRDVLQRMEMIFEGEGRPVVASALTLSFSPRTVWSEAWILASGLSRLARLRRFCRTYVNLAIGKVMMALKLRSGDIHWGRYKADVADNTDFRKFDGTLKVVLDATSEAADLLEQSLEAMRRAGRLVYGLHRSRATLLTCMVRSYAKEHVHFVDGADGGYAMAAKQLKAQLAALARPATSAPATSAPPAGPVAVASKAS